MPYSRSAHDVDAAGVARVWAILLEGEAEDCDANAARRAFNHEKTPHAALRHVAAMLSLMRLPARITWLWPPCISVLYVRWQGTVTTNLAATGHEVAHQIAAEYPQSGSSTI